MSRDLARDEPGGCLRSWPGGVRHEGGASVPAGPCGAYGLFAGRLPGGVVVPVGAPAEPANRAFERHRCGGDDLTTEAGAGAVRLSPRVAVGLMSSAAAMTLAAVRSRLAPV